MFFSVSPMKGSFDLRGLRIYTLFYKERFFSNWTSVLLNFFMNGASKVAQVLLNTKNHHYVKTQFLFNMCVQVQAYIFIIRCCIKKKEVSSTEECTA